MSETPDGRPLTHAMCTCASHCANSCEPSHCPETVPWCACWCHGKLYDAMASCDAAIAAAFDRETPIPDNR